MIRVVLIGCVHSSRVAFDALTRLSDRVTVVGLMTRRNSAYNSDFEDLSGPAEAASCPIVYVEDHANDADQAEEIHKWAPDVVFCVGWSKLLGPKMLQLAPYGVIGYHPAALPQNRGRHPLIWALALGLEKTASTFFVMDEGADSGAIANQAEVEISFEDDAQSLYQKISNLIPTQIEQIVHSISDRRFSPVPQENAQASYWRKRVYDDGRIDWRMSATAIYNLVRALSPPYPGAFVSFNGKSFKVWKCHPLPSTDKNIEPGKVVDVSNTTFTVKCGEGAIKVLVHDFSLLPEKGTYL